MHPTTLLLAALYFPDNQSTKTQLDASSSTSIRLNLFHHIRILLIRLGPIIMIDLGADPNAQVCTLGELSRILDLATILWFPELAQTKVPTPPLFFHNKDV